MAHASTSYRHASTSYRHAYDSGRFTDKCDELVQRCLLPSKFDFRVFCDIWKKMDMSSIFVGKTDAEALEFAQEVIQIGKQYMLKETSNFRETEAGIFMVYAFLSLQPDEGLVYLPILPEDKLAIDRLKADVKRKKRTGVRYALKSILTKGPVKYEEIEDDGELQHRVTPIPVETISSQLKGIFSATNPKWSLTKDPIITNANEMDTNFNVIDENSASALEASFMTLSVSNNDFEVHASQGSDTNESGIEDSLPTEKTSAPCKTLKIYKGKTIPKTKENPGKTKKPIEHALNKRKYIPVSCRKTKISKVVDPNESLPSTSGSSFGICEQALMQVISADTKKNYKHLFKLPTGSSVTTDVIKKPDQSHKKKEIKFPKVEIGSQEKLQHIHTKNCKTYKRKKPTENNLMPETGTVSSTTNERHLILKKPRLLLTTKTFENSTIVNEAVIKEVMDTN